MKYIIPIIILSLFLLGCKAEEEATKTEINDQSKYLIDQKIEVLKTLN